MPLKYGGVGIGVHQGPSPWDAMMCSADRYEITPFTEAELAEMNRLNAEHNARVDAVVRAVDWFGIANRIAKLRS
jgi:hypothetical protein